MSSSSTVWDWLTQLQGGPEGHLVTSPVTPVPRVGKVHLPGPDCCFLRVLSAEKVTSLGKDWHRGCLRCVKCNKTLTSGSHAEVRKHHLLAPGRPIRASHLRKRINDTVAKATKITCSSFSGVYMTLLPAVNLLKRKDAFLHWLKHVL